MPATLSYPGVYIEEIPSGVHTITGVATSITAFVGRALRGPVDTDEKNSPVLINSYGEFERIFGGLWVESTLSYAVRDFFANGGSQALIVRVYKNVAGTISTGKLTVDTLSIKAASPGAWGGFLRVRIDHDTRTTKAFPTEDLTKLFNLTVKDTQTNQIEIFRNVSTALDHPRFIDKVLGNESTLISIDMATPANTNRPVASGAITPPDMDPFSDNDPSRYTVVPSANLPVDGIALARNEVSDPSLEATKTGMYALLRADLFNLICIPPHTPSSVGTDVEAGLIDDATTFCRNHRAFFIVDPPYSQDANVQSAKTGIKTFLSTAGFTITNYAALYFPTLRQPNPLHDNQIEEFAPCGTVAGIMARIDAQRGVWKAPAGQETALVGVPKLSCVLNDADNGELNPLGINCLRTMPAIGRVVWGARTLEGDDRLGSEWKYIPVRRLALYIEESLYRGTQWVVFEPNDEPLWSQIRLNVGAFMHDLFRQGAFQGKTPQEAYFVKCDKETTTQTDIDHGIVNILVGFAPLKPAEFVVIQIQQMAGQIAT
jgi:hypothetical protein